jgi:hypothetical protein
MPAVQRSAQRAVVHVAEFMPAPNCGTTSSVALAHLIHTQQQIRGDPYTTRRER